MVKNIYLGDRDEPTKLSLLRNPGNEQRAKMKSGVDKMLPICKITGMVIIRKKVTLAGVTQFFGHLPVH